MAALLPATARAHVAFDAPLAGDTLVAGETVSLAWTDLVLHDPEGFDLDLLLSEDGEVIPIAHGLSIETHSYEWTVPDQPCTGCLLRVIQFNTFNYDYWETIPITITNSGAPGGSGGMAGAAGGANAGTSGSADAGQGGVESGAGGAPSSEGGSTSAGGSEATAGTAGSSVANGGSSFAGTPSAGAPSAGTGTTGDTDTSAEEGCSSSPGAPSSASPWFVMALLAGVAALLRVRRRPVSQG